MISSLPFYSSKQFIWVLLTLQVVLGVALPPNLSADHILEGDNVVETFVMPTPSVFQVHFNLFGEMLDALTTMQDRFFEVWLGKWPTTIDWTGAVMGTYVSACMISILHSQRSAHDSVASLSNNQSENIFEQSMNKYFSQVVSYYFGENAFDVRHEAYDDILWVVLGWLEALKFVKLRSNYAALDYPNSTLSWWGGQFSSAFAHRAHVFYNLAESGWDEKLCGGGLAWNSRLEPYKNTITNTLFITASVNMYLYHPGDDNASPYTHDSGRLEAKLLPPAHAHDQRYLKAAIAGYEWLKSVNLTNELGLYVDGYHIRNWQSGQTTCNIRNEMMYTYNQGVLLSGLRGLWESTGNKTYLDDAHELVRNVIAATGWSLGKQDVLETSKHWCGLGSQGILTEFCDPSGTCSQDGQTFKGIFFHHLTALCAALPVNEANATIPGTSYVADSATAAQHERKCSSYIKWVARNAKSAIGTKNEDGLFGMWWGASTDYVDEEPSHTDRAFLVGGSGNSVDEAESTPKAVTNQGVESPSHFLRHASVDSDTRNSQPAIKDVNNRGRGRTIETHSGGLMVVRALWELLREYGDDI